MRMSDGCCWTCYFAVIYDIWDEFVGPSALDWMAFVCLLYYVDLYPLDRGHSASYYIWETGPTVYLEFDRGKMYYSFWKTI